jgi:hypothetical protein
MSNLPTRSSASLFAACILCLIVIGCRDGRPGRVPVGGTVLIDGKPLTSGSIMFIAQGLRPAGSALDQSGRFKLSCYERGDGAVPATYRVKVRGIEPVNERSNRWLAPKKYADERSSGIEVKVTEPVDDLKIELTWDGKKPFIERW